MMRWCDSAVVWILSTASVAVVQRSIETKSELSGGKIVVNRLGHTDDIHAALEELKGDGLRALTADADDSVDPQLAGVADDFLGNIACDFLAVFDDAVFERIAAVGGTQNRFRRAAESRSTSFSVSS